MSDRVTRALAVLRGLVLFTAAVSCDRCTRAEVFRGCLEERCPIVETARCKSVCAAYADAWQDRCEAERAASDPAERIREQATATYGQ